MSEIAKLKTIRTIVEVASSAFQSIGEGLALEGKKKR